MPPSRDNDTEYNQMLIAIDRELWDDLKSRCQSLRAHNAAIIKRSARLRLQCAAANARTAAAWRKADRR